MFFGPLVSFTSIHFGNGSLSITNNMGFEHIWVVLLLDGVFASGVVWVINTIQEYFENK